MKISKFSFLAILALGSLLAVGQFANAQDAKPEGKAPAADGKRPGGQEFLKKMIEDLQLTDDQKTKFAAIMKEQAEKLKELRDDTSLSREDKMGKLREMREANQAKIKEILTPEQKEKYDKIIAEQRARFKKKDQ